MLAVWPGLPGILLELPDICPGLPEIFSRMAWNLAGLSDIGQGLPHTWPDLNNLKKKNLYNLHTLHTFHTLHDLHYLHDLCNMHNWQNL